MSNVLTKQIRERIELRGENTLYMVRDFADLNNDGLVTRALSRLEKEGMLVRNHKEFTFILCATVLVY